MAAGRNYRLRQRPRVLAGRVLHADDPGRHPDRADTRRSGELAVERQGRPFKHQDFNFWGVTFARDSNTFYATVSSGGVFYLVRGDATTRRGRGHRRRCRMPFALARQPPAGVQEASDDQRPADLAAGAVRSRQRTHDLVSGETRSVDDQVEWLDDQRILYSTPSPDRPGSMTVSVASVDEGSTTQLLADAYSPSAP